MHWSSPPLPSDLPQLQYFFFLALQSNQDKSLKWVPFFELPLSFGVKSFVGKCMLALAGTWIRAHPFLVQWYLNYYNRRCSYPQFIYSSFINLSILNNPRRPKGSLSHRDDCSPIPSVFPWRACSSWIPWGKKKVLLFSWAVWSRRPSSIIKSISN